MKNRSVDARFRLKSVLLLLAVFCTGSLLGQSAGATVVSGEDALLFQRTLGINRSVNIFDTDEFDLDLQFGDSFFSPANPVSLFDDLVITPEDVGKTFEATVASDDDFLAVADRLTDPQEEFIALRFTENQTNGLTEQRGWKEDLFLVNSPTTFRGSSSSAIRSVMLTVDLFTLVPAGTLPSSPSSQPVDLMLTLSILGVPEPTSVWLLAVGFVTLSTVRRRHGGR